MSWRALKSWQRGAIIGIAVGLLLAVGNALLLGTGIIVFYPLDLLYSWFTGGSLLIDLTHCSGEECLGSAVYVGGLLFILYSTLLGLLIGLKRPVKGIVYATACLLAVLVVIAILTAIINFNMDKEALNAEESFMLIIDNGINEVLTRGVNSELRIPWNISKPYASVDIDAEKDSIVGILPTHFEYLAEEGRRNKIVVRKNYYPYSVKIKRFDYFELTLDYAKTYDIERVASQGGGVNCISIKNNGTSPQGLPQILIDYIWAENCV